MITTGIIKGIKIDSTNLKGNLYKVEVSIFKTPTNADTQDAEVLATCSLPPGIYQEYSIGDTVYVDFVNNQFTYPVIIGKIYKGTGAENSPSAGYFNVNNLNVKEVVTLPKDFKVGEITYERLLNCIKTIEIAKKSGFL